MGAKAENAEVSANNCPCGLRRRVTVNLTTADISDSAGGQMVLAAIRKRWPWVKHLFADGAYDRKGMMDNTNGLRW